MGFYDRDFRSQDFTVHVDGEEVPCRLFSPPPEKLAPEPLLYLSCANTIELSLRSYPYCVAVEVMLEQGHRVVSFDPPHHGSRSGSVHGAEIPGMRAAFLAGADPFRRFVREGQAVIDRCISLGAAEPGRIVIGGVSRSGYMSLRLYAEEPRIAALAAFCPVTDWRVIGFTEERDRADVAALRLSTWAERLAGKPMMIIVPNHDWAVSTECCLQFYLDVQQANEEAGYGKRHVDLIVTDEVYHTCSGSWYAKAAEFLIRRALPVRRNG
ncbi:alpha/beta hydrolase family protein [Paenibacillus cymbidii]|uniref:alpha/beta hydrolase family protein n=1 Tax=Paenibacillus cymbidii TaxID=1639034 RepID=UPI001081CF97|nr:hypothetical protein [Paenibacillus cymbidii]